VDITPPNPTFFNASGAIHSAGMVGRSITISPACSPAGCGGSPPPAAPGTYYPASLSPPPVSQEPACTPSSCTGDYEDLIASCSPQPITCGISPNAAVDLTSSCSNFNTSTDNATACLIHSLAGSDTITVGGGPPVTQPPRFVAGSGSPLLATGKVNAGDQISTSDSLVTIPVYDGTPLIPSGNTASVNVIGFIQGFVQSANASGQITLTIVNLSGCGSSPSGPPVIGDGVSPVPVHLIQ
jgi:hypothetical protein